jgi:hypothetical protein
LEEEMVPKGKNKGGPAKKTKSAPVDDGDDGEDDDGDEGDGNQQATQRKKKQGN